METCLKERKGEMEFEILKNDIEFYVGNMMREDIGKAEEVLKRLSAVIMKQRSVIEKMRMKTEYEASCLRCGSVDVEWLEKVHSCVDCDVWVISCNNCNAEWLDIVWKNVGK